MKIIEVKTQAELDAAIDAADLIRLISGKFFLSTEKSVRIEMSAGVEFKLVARGSSQPHVVARESSQPRVEAWESSQPRVEAWGSSQPYVEARESSRPHVEARESSQPRVEAWGSSQPHVVAWGSSQPHVVALRSSQPRVEAWESSQPRVEAWGSSQPHVVARESSQPRVVAWAYVQLSILGAVAVTATANVSVLIQGVGAKVKGGRQIRRKPISTAKQWCDFYGVEVKNGLAMLFKAVDDDYSTVRARRAGIVYEPGSKPEASDWDCGLQECGGGLHFSASPLAALSFNKSATRFVACPVKISDIAVHKTPQYPNKIKAPRVAAPIWECDRYGKPIKK